MFKKIPYGLKVRVRGNDETGYVAERATYCSRFFPFIDDWTLIRGYREGHLFRTVETARNIAMREYNSWISFYERKEEEQRLTKKLKQSRVIWKHP